MEKVKAFLVYIKNSNELELIEEHCYEQYQVLTYDVILDKVELEFIDVKKFNQFNLIVNCMTDLSINKKEVIRKLLNIYLAIFKPRE